MVGLLPIISYEFTGVSDLHMLSVVMQACFPYRNVGCRRRYIALQKLVILVQCVLKNGYMLYNVLTYLVFSVDSS